MKPKTATWLRNQSSPLIDRFNSSIRSVIAPQDGDDDADDADADANKRHTPYIMTGPREEFFFSATIFIHLLLHDFDNL